MRQIFCYLKIFNTSQKLLFSVQKLHNPIVKIGRRDIATQLTKCNKCHKNKSTFLKETKPKRYL